MLVAKQHKKQQMERKQHRLKVEDLNLLSDIRKNMLVCVIDMQFWKQNLVRGSAASILCALSSESSGLNCCPIRKGEKMDDVSFVHL